MLFYYNGYIAEIYKQLYVMWIFLRKPKKDAPTYQKTK